MKLASLAPKSRLPPTLIYCFFISISHEHYWQRQLCVQKPRSDNTWYCYTRCFKILLLCYESFLLFLIHQESRLGITEKFYHPFHPTPLLFLHVMGQGLVNFFLNGQIVYILGLGHKVSVTTTRLCLCS